MENFSRSYGVTYGVGEITRPHHYNQDVDLICTSGIHYFLSLEAALNYRHGIIEQYVRNDNGLYICTYSDEGRLYKERITVSQWIV